MIILPEWRYNLMKQAGWDMSHYQKALPMPKPDPDRVVVYLNRESRRKAARSRRKK